MGQRGRSRVGSVSFMAGNGGAGFQRSGGQHPGSLELSAF